MIVPSWVKGTSLLALTLAAGVTIGVSYERHRTAAHEAVGMDAHDAMHRFTRALDLDAAQQAAIAPCPAPERRACTQRLLFGRQEGALTLALSKRERGGDTHGLTRMRGSSHA